MISNQPNRNRYKGPAVISAAAIAIVIPMTKLYEGTIKKTYADPILGWQVPTACRGHTGSWNGKLLQQGDTWTEEECDQMLSFDLKSHYADAMRCVNNPDVLSPEEKAAWLDFAINVGAGNFCNGSPARLINSGNRKGACSVILAYRFVGKLDCFIPENKCMGIHRRRHAQYNLCMAGAK